MKITVELCMGTTCFVMGASSLPEFAESFTDEENSQIEVKHSPCMGFCKDNKYGKAPYVKINDEVLSSVTSQLIVEKIKGLLSN